MRGEAPLLPAVIVVIGFLKEEQYLPQAGPPGWGGLVAVGILLLLVLLTVLVVAVVNRRHGPGG